MIHLAELKSPLADFNRAIMQLINLVVFLHVAHVFAIQSSIFHGTTVAIQPNPDDPSSRNASFFASNFFALTTPVGYLSFGWWLPASLAADTSGCIPNPESFHWYEHSRGNCTLEAGCRFHIKNIAMNDPKGVEAPDFPEEGVDYVVVSLDLGNPPFGLLALSYVDNESGGYGVGTRQVLSVYEDTAEECEDAFNTISAIVKERKIDLGFELTNPCYKGSRNMLYGIQWLLGGLSRQQHNMPRHQNVL